MFWSLFRHFIILTHTLFGVENGFKDGLHSDKVGLQEESNGVGRVNEMNKVGWAHGVPKDAVDAHYSKISCDESQQIRSVEEEKCYSPFLLLFWLLTAICINAEKNSFSYGLTMRCSQSRKLSMTGSVTLLVRPGSLSKLGPTILN